MSISPSAVVQERPPKLSDPIRIGLLGFGTVGSGAYRMLQDNRDAITQKIGRPIEVAKIGVRNWEKPRILAQDMFTTDLDSLVNDPTIDVVIELIGVIDPAGRLVEAALMRGKSVVTA